MTGRPTAHTEASTASFEKNPASGHTPARASVPTMNTTPVCGITRQSPPMRKMSLVPTAWMTAPAPRKSSALKTPCVRRWKKPAALAPAPAAAIM